MKLKKTLITSLALLLLLVGVLHSNDSVFCIGKDGHFALEYAINGNCGELKKSTQDCSPEEESSHLHFSATDSHCGECFDFPLLKSEAIVANTVDYQSSTLSAIQKLSGLLTSIIFPETIAVHNSDFTSFSLPHNLDYRRTTVLLI